MRSFRIVVALMLAVCATSSVAQVTRQGQGYLFRMKLTKGQVLRYTIISEMGTPAQALRVEMPMVQRVLDVQNRVASIEMRAGPMQMNNQPLGQAVTTRVRIDDSGRSVGTGSGATFATFPREAIRVGGTWRAALSPAVQAGAASAAQNPITAVYTFRRITSWEGRQIAEIGLTVDSKGPQKISGKGTIRVSMRDGTILNMTMEAKGTGPQGESMPARVRVVRS